MTGQCATLTSAGSTPVACSARAIFKDEDVRGSHAPLAMTRVTRRSSRHPTLVITSSRRAPKARRELANRVHPGSLLPHPGPSCPRTIRFFPCAAWTTCTHASARTQHGQLLQAVVVELSSRLRARIGPDARRAKARPPRPLPVKPTGTGSKLSWQSARLLTGEVLVRIQPIPPQ